jgi:hypothetical protein
MQLTLAWKNNRAETAFHLCRICRRISSISSAWWDWCGQLWVSIVTSISSISPIGSLYQIIMDHLKTKIPHHSRHKNNVKHTLQVQQMLTRHVLCKGKYKFERVINSFQYWIWRANSISIRWIWFFVMLTLHGLGLRHILCVHHSFHEQQKRLILHTTQKERPTSLQNNFSCSYV